MTLVFGLYMISRLGISAFASNRASFDESIRSYTSGGYSFVFQRRLLTIVPIAAGFASLALIFQEGGRAWRKTPIVDKVLTSAVIGLALFVNNPMSAPRNVLGAMVLAFAFAVIRPSSIRLRRIAFVAIILGILFAYPAASAFRREGGTAQTSLQSALVETADFSMFGQVHVAYDYVSQEGIRDGRQLASAAFILVPRSVWHGKAFDTGDVIHDGIGFPERLNQSSPLWVEFFVDWSWPGVVLGFLLFGLLTSRLEYEASRAGPLTWPGLFVPVLAAYQLYLLRGSLMAFLIPFGLLSVSLYLTTRQPRVLTAPRAVAVRQRA